MARVFAGRGVPESLRFPLLYLLRRIPREWLTAHAEASAPTASGSPSLLLMYEDREEPKPAGWSPPIPLSCASARRHHMLESPEQGLSGDEALAWAVPLSAALEGCGRRRTGSPSHRHRLLREEAGRTPSPACPRVTWPGSERRVTTSSCTPAARSTRCAPPWTPSLGLSRWTMSGGGRRRRPSPSSGSRSPSCYIGKLKGMGRVWQWKPDPPTRGARGGPGTAPALGDSPALRRCAPGGRARPRVRRAR